MRGREFLAKIARLGGLARARQMNKPEKVEAARKAGWCRSQLRSPEDLRAQAALARAALQAKRERQEKVREPQAQPVQVEPVALPEPPAREEEPELPPWLDSDWCDSEIKRLRALPATMMIRTAGFSRLPGKEVFSDGKATAEN